MSGSLDNITIPTNPPPELKARCADFLKRAAETRKAEPVIAYWCTLAAAESALEMKDRSSEGTNFLLSLMDTLEAMKDALSDNEAVTSAAAGAAYVENFALRVFMNADNMDRAGKWDKTVIRAFLAASHFFAVLKSCNGGELSEEIEEKQQYARWKAADLARALREGREPVHGPPVPEEPLVPESDLPAIPSAPTDDAVLPSVPSAPEGSPGRRANAPPSVEIPDGDSGTWSTMATPGVEGPSSGLPSIPQHSPSASITSPPVPPKDLPSSPSSTPRKGSSGSDKAEKEPKGGSASLPKPRSSSMSRSHSGGSEKEKKNVRFMGPDGAPLSPGEELGDVGKFDEPSAPPPSEVSAVQASAPPQSPPTPAKPHLPLSPRSPPTPAKSPPTPAKSPQTRSPQARSPQAPPPSLPTGFMPQPPPSSGAGGFVPGFAPGIVAGAVAGQRGMSTPPPTAAQAAYAGHAYASTPPPATPPHGGTAIYPSGPARKLNRKETEQVQKHARWAISALEFDDYDTAKKELIKALEMLG